MRALATGSSRPAARIALALALALAAGLAPPAGAATSCEAPSLLVRWPEERPVWELCWTRPRDSSGPGSIDGASTRPAGSGLELTGVRYRGLPVLERANAPVVWARWAEGGEPGCAGRCLRAPMSLESPFAAGAEVVPGWYEPDPPSPASPAPLWPLVTVCDRPPGAPPSGATAPGDCPWGEPLACVTGVSVDRGEERLVLTAQLAAGELRYVMSWTFHLDGTFEPRFAFAGGGTACAGTPVREHVVWRLDVDLRGDERLLAAGDGDGWRVAEAAADHGLSIVSGAGDLEPALHASAGAADPFAGLTGGCGFDPGALPPYAGTDLVLWYHAAAEGAGTGCRTVGPTLMPFGRWPLGEPIFESGFESGDLDAWSTAQSRTGERIFEGGFEAGDLEGWSTPRPDHEVEEPD